MAAPLPPSTSSGWGGVRGGGGRARVPSLVIVFSRHYGCAGARRHDPHPLPLPILSLSKGGRGVASAAPSLTKDVPIRCRASSEAGLCQRTWEAGRVFGTAGGALGAPQIRRVQRAPPESVPTVGRSLGLPVLPGCTQLGALPGRTRSPGGFSAMPATLSPSAPGTAGLSRALRPPGTEPEGRGLRRSP